MVDSKKPKKETHKSEPKKHGTKKHDLKAHSSSASTQHKREPLRSHRSDSKPRKDENVKNEEINNSSKKKILIGAGIGAILIVAILLIGLFALMPSSEDDTSQSNMEADNESQSIVPGGEEVIATVNGEDITQEEIFLVQQQLMQQGVQANEEQALEQVLTNKVLLQEVAKQDYQISTQEAETELEQVLSQQGFTVEDLKQDLQSRGISYEATLEDFKERVAVDRYLSENINLDSIEVTQEEIEALYNQFAMQGGNQTPPLEQIRPQIEMQIEQQKTRELQSQFIETLIEAAEVEYMN